ncbi:MAG: acetylornithine deacetylase, partial [Duncaniella sp.]|nr:acetylornithine deacetylase [Duncaniella sp.]
EENVSLTRSSLSPHTTLTPRSTRIRASVIDPSHPLVRAAEAMGCEPFVSPTTSDMSLMPFPSLKMGPGSSARSHRADEYILLSEIEEAIPQYINLITSLKTII